MNTLTEQLKKDTAEGLSLLQSDDWRQYLIFLKKRNERLQGNVNDAVRKGDILEARVCLALMEDSQKQAEVFKQNIMQKKQEMKSNA